MPLASAKLEPNAIFPATPCGRSAEEQALIHQHSGIVPDGIWADPILALVEGVYAIGAALGLQYPGFGAVITNQDILVRKPYRIGLLTTMSGRVTSLEPNARGAVFTSAFMVTNDTEGTLAEMTTTILLFDPSKPAPAMSERPPKSVVSAEPVETETIGDFAFTPEATRHFEIGHPPSPHTDPDLARAAGFPKPIVSGNQVFSMIWKRFVEPHYLMPVSLNFILKRPILWDEQITFEKWLADQGATATIEVRKDDGKTAIVCEIAGHPIAR